MLHIAKDFRLRRVLFRPLPFGLEFRIETVGVVDTFSTFDVLECPAGPSDDITTSQGHLIDASGSRSDECDDAQPLKRRHQLVVAFQGGVQSGAVDDHAGLLVVSSFTDTEQYESSATQSLDWGRALTMSPLVTLNNRQNLESGANGVQLTTNSEGASQHTLELGSN